MEIDVNIYEKIKYVKLLKNLGKRTKTKRDKWLDGPTQHPELNY